MNQGQLTCKWCRKKTNRLVGLSLKKRQYLYLCDDCMIKQTYEVGE